MKKTLLFLIFFIAISANAIVIEDGIYIIKSSINPNFVIDLNGGRTTLGNNIQLWDKNNSDAQRWIIKNVNGTVKICSVINSHYVIDLNEAHAVCGENIQCWEDNGSNAQQWFPRKVGSYYEFRSAVNQNFTIDLCNSQTVRGQNIHCWEANGTNAQRWILERVGNSGTNSPDDSGLLYSGPYTMTGMSYDYSTGQYQNSGVSGVYQVEIYRDRIIIMGETCAQWRTDGQWLWYGVNPSNSNHPKYLYNTSTGELRWRTVLSLFGFVQITDGIWVRGNQVAGSTGTGTSTGGTSNGGTTTTSPVKTRCGSCDGTGTVIYYNGPYNSSADKWCGQCHKTVSNNHYHRTCRACNGKGWWSTRP